MKSLTKDYLQKSFEQRLGRLLQASNPDLFLFHLNIFWHYLKDNPYFSRIINCYLEDETLEKKYHQIIAKKIEFDTIKNEERLFSTTIFLIRDLVELGENESKRNNIITNAIAEFLDRGNNRFYEKFNQLYIVPFGEIIFDKIDFDYIITELSKRFKEKIEWFRKDQARKLHEEETIKGEDNLAKLFYEYMHDNGVEIVVEPKSNSGRIDLVVFDSPNKKILADAKIFDNKGRNKNYIAKGVNQVLIHLKEINETVGFLLIYELCEESISFNLKQTFNGLPLYEIDGRKIFFITVDLYSYKDSSSKRGKLKNIDLDENDFRDRVLK